MNLQRHRRQINRLRVKIAEQEAIIEGIELARRLLKQAVADAQAETEAALQRPRGGG